MYGEENNGILNLQSVACRDIAIMSRKYAFIHSLQTAVQRQTAVNLYLKRRSVTSLSQK